MKPVSVLIAAVLGACIPLGVAAQGSGQIQCIIDEDLSVDAGAMLAPIGPSGVGKTTTLRLLTGPGAPTTGGATTPDQCIADLVDWFERTGATPPLPDGTPFEPGYFLFDWDDQGAYVPLLGVSTGLPIQGGIIPDGLMNPTRGSTITTVVLAYDPVYIDIRNSIGLDDATPESGEGAAAVASAVAAADAGAGEDPEPAVSLFQLRPLAAVSASLLDDHGSAVWELRCERNITALGLELSGGQRARVAVARTLVEEPAMLILDCPGGFETIP